MVEDLKASLLAIVEQLAPEFRAQGEQDIDAVLQTGVSSHDDLLALARDRTANTDMRIKAIWLLGRLGAKRAVYALLAAVGDTDANVRRATAQALGELRNKRAVRPLLAAMVDDDDGEVRVAAAQALGALGDKRASEPLMSVLGNPAEDPRVRGMAAEALADLGDRRAVPSLIVALSDPSPEVRFWAAFALGELGDPLALADLERLAATDDAVVPRWGAVSQEAATAIRHIQASGDR